MNGPPDLAVAAFHWLEDLGLLAAVGAFVVRRLARQRPHLRWADPPLHVFLGAAFAGGVLVLVSGPGWVVGIRVVAEGAALVMCLRGVRPVAPFTVFAAATLAFSSHAAALPQPGGAVFADVLHVLAAGMWAGGILALASVRPPGGWGGADGRLLLDRFGRVAFIAFGVTALTGVLRATEQLAAPSDLWTTRYGLVLALKVTGVLLMVGLSTLGWRRRRVAGAEAAAAVAVAGLTALLAAFPLDAR